MRADTAAIALAISAQEAFDYLSNPRTLPEWAVGFARGIRRDGDDWIVETKQGDVGIRYETEPSTGAIDFHFSLAPGIDSIAYSRVVPNGEGAEYVFTQLQAPGMPDEAFEANLATIREELAVLAAILRARASCPIPQRAAADGSGHD